MTRTIFWTFLAVTAVVGIGIAIAKSVAADKAQTKALRAERPPHQPGVRLQRPCLQDLRHRVALRHVRQLRIPT